MIKSLTDPSVDSVVSDSLSLSFSVIKASNRSILIELYEPLKEKTEVKLLEECISQAKFFVEKHMRDYVKSGESYIRFNKENDNI